MERRKKEKVGISGGGCDVSVKGGGGSRKLQGKVKPLKRTLKKLKRRTRQKREVPRPSLRDAGRQRGQPGMGGEKVMLQKSGVRGEVSI